MKLVTPLFTAIGLIVIATLVVSAQTRPAGPLGIKSPPRDVLPPITMGKWTGQYAYYEHPHFDVVVGTNGFMTLYLKDKGQPVGQPITVERAIIYQRDPQELGVLRRVLSFDDPPAPGRIQGSLSFRGTAEDNVRFETRITIDKNTVALAMKYDEPKNLTYQATLHYGWRMPPTHTFPPNTNPEKIARALEGYSFEMQPAKGDLMKFSFHEPTTLTNYVEHVSIRGPWGPRRLTLRQKNGLLHVVSYHYSPLYMGYSLGKYVRPGVKDEPLQFIIE